MSSRDLLLKIINSLFVEGLSPEEVYEKYRVDYPELEKSTILNFRRYVMAYFENPDELSPLDSYASARKLFDDILKKLKSLYDVVKASDPRTAVTVLTEQRVLVQIALERLNELIELQREQNVTKSVTNVLIMNNYNLFLEMEPTLTEDGKVVLSKPKPELVSMIREKVAKFGK